MTWLYESQEITEIPEEYAGFVYLITNKLTGRMYIGKKKRKKIRGTIDSDWQTYYGSSPELSRDVELLGTENFTREILYYCKSKSECSYVEAREQFARRVLESDDYYNGHIQVRVHGSHIKNKL